MIAIAWFAYLAIAHQRITNAITERDAPVQQIDLFATA